MSEQIVKFGQGLVGILHSGGDSGERAPVVLMFNAGFLHRVGPFRLWVDLAREFSASGVASLRFDLAGLGESKACDTGAEAVQVAIESLQAAMDLVESLLGKREFVVIGLCSGADYAHPGAKADPRIRGVVFIDGYGYRTAAYRFRHFFKRFVSFRRWKSLIKRSLRQGLVEPELIDDEARAFPKVEQVQSDILSFLEQGRRLFYIYTAGVPDYYIYENQFWEMFPRVKPHPRLSYRYFPTTDHTFSLVSERQDLKRQLVSFVLN